MNRHRLSPVSLALALALVAATPALAADGSHASADRSAAITQGANDIRMSELIGMEVVDRDGDEIGEVKDLVLSDRDGSARYAVIDAGGFLGIGEHRTAVPISKISPERDGDRIRVDMTREQLQRYPSYPPDRRPDWNDPGWRSRVDGAAPAPAGQGRQGVARFRRGSDLLDAQLRDEAGRDVGEVKDVVLDARTGKVRYGIAEFDPSYVQGGRDVILTPDQVSPATGAEGDLVVIADRDALRQAPTWRGDR